MESNSYWIQLLSLLFLGKLLVCSKDYYGYTKDYCFDVEFWRSWNFCLNIELSYSAEFESVVCLSSSLTRRAILASRPLILAWCSGSVDAVGFLNDASDDWRIAVIASEDAHWESMKSTFELRLTATRYAEYYLGGEGKTIWKKKKMIFTRRMYQFTIGCSNCFSLVGCGVYRLAYCTGYVLRLSNGEVRLELLLSQLLRATDRVAVFWRGIPIDTGTDVWIR